MQHHSTRDISVTYEGIRIQCDVSIMRRCRHSSYNATLTAFDIKTRDVSARTAPVVISDGGINVQEMSLLIGHN